MHVRYWTTVVGVVVTRLRQDWHVKEPDSPTAAATRLVVVSRETPWRCASGTNVTDDSWRLPNFDDAAWQAWQVLARGSVSRN